MARDISKLKDKLHAVKGLDSSSAYNAEDEDEKQKKQAAQLKSQAQANAVKQALEKTRSGNAAPKYTTYEAPLKQTTEVQTRSSREAMPGKEKERATSGKSVTQSRKDQTTSILHNIGEALKASRAQNMDAQRTYSDLSGLAAGAKNAAVESKGWAAEAAEYGNNALKSWYQSAEKQLTATAANAQRRITEMLSPASVQQEVENENTYARLLDYWTDKAWGTGERQATEEEITTGAGKNESFIADLEKKQAAGTITSAEERVLQSLYKAREAYDSGDVSVYDNDIDEAQQAVLDSQQGYLQSRTNVDFLAGKAQQKMQEISDRQIVPVVLDRMQQAGASVEDYEAEREALYQDYMDAGSLKTVFKKDYDLLNYTPEQYAAYRWTEENEPENLDYLKEYLDISANARISQGAQEYWSDPDRADGMNNIFGNTVLGIIGRLSGLINTADIALQSLAVAGGARNRIDYNRTGWGVQAGEGAVSAQAEKLAELGNLGDAIPGLKDTWLGELNLGDLYRNGVDSAVSILNGAMFGAWTGAATTAQVYSGAFADAKERGASDKQAGLFAAFSSAAEGAGEQVSFGVFQKLIVGRGMDKKAGGKILLGLIQKAEEGGQEFVTEELNILADRFIMQELSQEEQQAQAYMAQGYDPDTAREIAKEENNERLMDAALSGFIGGAMRSGGAYAAQGISNAAGSVQTAIDDRARGRQIQKMGNAQQMAQLMSEVTGETVTPETSKRKLGKQQREFVENASGYIDKADEATRDIVRGKVYDVANASTEALDGTSQAAKEKAGKRLAAMKTSDTGASVGGENVTVQGFVKTAEKGSDAKLNIKKADGTLAEADIADVTFDSKTADVYSYAADMATADLANNFHMSILPEQMGKIERVVTAYNNAYDMAKAGFKTQSIAESSLLKDENGKNMLTKAQFDSVIDLANKARKSEQIATIAKAAERAKANMGNAWKGGKATFDDSVVVDALDDTQKAQIDVASVFTGSMGVNVVFFESKADESGRFTRENGSYNRKTNTIYVDVNAGRYYKGDSPSKTALLRTLSHEVTHAVQRNSPEIYAELRDTVTDILGDAKGVTIEDLIDRKMAADSSLTTRDAAMDELVADACERMIEDSDAAQRLAEAHPEAAKTIFQKVGELLKKIGDAIKAAFKGRQLSTEAQLVMKDVERYQAVVDLWTKGVMQTAEVSGREMGKPTDSEEMGVEVEEATSGEAVGLYNEPAQPAETHIDNRTWENVGERSVKAFMNEYRGVRAYMYPALQILRSDVRDSTRGERLMIRDEEGYAQSMTGQQRETTDQIAELKDRGYTWEQLSETLDMLENELRASGEENALPDTAIVKRIELALDDMLTNGYDSLGGGMGVQYAPDAEYIKYKASLPGAAEYDVAAMEQAEGRQFVDDVQFQARSFSEQIDELAEGVFPRNDHLYVMQTPDVLVGVGLKKLPMLMTQRHAKTVMKTNGNDRKANYHGLTKNGIKQLPQRLSEPAMIIQATDYSNRVIVLTDMQNGSGETVIAPIMLDGRGNWQDVEIDANILTTAYGKENIKSMIVDAIMDDRVLYTDKKRSDTLSQTVGVQFPKNLRSGGFIHSIRLNQQNVNPDIQKQTRDQLETPEFQRWFKDSKIVNEDGSPKLMYHGTPYGGFTVFKDWQYFTDNREYADVYHSPSASSIRGRYNDATNPMTYAVYLNVKKPFDTRDPKIRRIWKNEFYDHYSRTPLTDKGLPDWTDGIDLVEFIEDNEYDFDAIILDEGAVGGYGDDVKSRGISVVVRNSNQIKSATNNIGTFDPDDPDIQHQTREEAISTRFVLANMLEADATNSEEAAWLRGYRGQLNELEMVLDAIDGNRQTVRELMFEEKTLSDGKRKLVMRKRTPEETERLKKAQNRIKILQEQVARMDEGLLNLENADVIRNLVEREAQKIRDREAEKRREGIAKVQENQRNAAIRKNIQRRAKRIDRMLRQPTDKEHIPEGLKGAILDMMEIFVGDGPAFGGSKADVIRAYRAQQEYEAMRGNEDYSDLASRYDEDTSERLKQLAKLMNDKDIAKFDNADLTLLSTIIEHFEHLIRDQNDAFAQSRRKITEGYAEQIWQQTMTMKGRKENAITGNALVKALKHMGHANVIPPYFFKHLDGAMGKLGNDLLKAEGRYGVNMNKAEARLAEIRDEYEHDKWASKKGDILKIETEIGDRLELTREQALGIWASAKRERLNTVQRATHLRDGGVILEKSARKLGIKGQEINVTPTKISQRDIQQIDKWLTDQQKQYADAMVGYISRDMAALGNETSMELAGYKKFGEGYYYPYKTSDDFRRTELGKVQDALIKNMGFTKSVTRGAKTPVVITDFSATVADHVNAMIMYNAFAVAQDQLMRVYDFKLDDSTSVKNLLRNAFGDEIPAYIEQLMRDLYGGVSPDRDAGLINWLVSAHKKQAVLGSLSVVVQQPTALIRAMSQINPKYFVGQRAKGGFNEAMDYAGTAVIKDIGGFDSGVGRGATDWLNGSPKDWRNHAIKSGLDTVSDWAGLGAEYADKLAWMTIWKAVKREQAAKYKMDINSPELKEIAGERFDEVIRLTQVYDSVLTKSQLMRNKNVFWKGATSFMSEPTVTWNMMYDAAIEAFKNKKGFKAGGIFASVLVSVILTNLAKAAVTAARDDDDEEATYLERYAKNAAEGLINDFVPFNYMPIVRDVYAKLEGFEVERADMVILNDIITAGVVMLNDEKAPIDKVKSLVELLSIVTGLPGKNIWRDVEAAFNTAGAVPQSEARPGWLENALRTGMVDATPIGKWFKLTDSKKNNADRMYDAIRGGDYTEAADLREHLKVYNGAKDDKAVDSLLRTRIKDGFTEGEIDADEAIEMLTGYAGMKQEDASDKVLEWQYAIDNDGSSYNDMRERYLEGEISYDDAVSDRVQYGGVENDKAKATVDKWEFERLYGYAYEDLREEHADGNVSSAEAMEIMQDYGGKDENEAYWEVTEWDYGDGWDGKGTLLNDAFAAGSDAQVRSRMQELAGHSDWQKPGNELASYVTDYYKPIYEAAPAAQKDALRQTILEYLKMAYEAVGEEYYGDDYALRYRSWLKK